MSSPRFRFRLERVRTVRQHSEDVASQELASALVTLEESERELIRAEEVFETAHNAMLETSGAPQSGADLQATQAWIELAERAHEMKLAELQRDEREVELRRATLTEAASERKALDRLEQRRRSEFEMAERRREVSALDEMALAPFTRTAA